MQKYVLILDINKFIHGSFLGMKCKTSLRLLNLGIGIPRETLSMRIVDYETNKKYRVILLKKK